MKVFIFAALLLILNGVLSQNLTLNEIDGLTYNQNQTSGNDTVSVELGSVGALHSCNATNGTNLTSLNATKPAPKTVIEETLDLLKDGDEKLQEFHHNETILFVGNTGSGKTTMTLFIAGDNKYLEAYKTRSRNILIRDPNEKISNAYSTTTSKTIFPQLVVNADTNTAFYDCPGFSDNRNTSVEVANTYFTKKVAEQAKELKIILIVSYNSVTHGGARTDFPQLLDHLSNLILNIDKYNDSIALIATKTISDNDDADVVEGIGEFLIDAKDNLREDNFVGRKIIDALLQKNPETQTYTKIEFFRQPKQVGLLSEIKSVQQNKARINRVIYNNTRYVHNAQGDFGFTLSHKALRDIRNFTDALNDQIHAEFKELRNFYEEHFGSTFRLNMTNVNSSLLAEIHSEISNLGNYALIIGNISTTLYLDQGTKAETYVQGILEALQTGLLKPPPKLFENIVNSAKYLDFFRHFTKSENSKSTNPAYWIEPLQQVLTDAKPSLQNVVENVENSISDTLETTSVELKTYFVQHLSQLKDHSNFTSELRRLLKAFRNVQNFKPKVANSVSLQGMKSPRKFINALIALLNSVDPVILIQQKEIILLTGADILGTQIGFSLLGIHFNSSKICPQWTDRLHKNIPDPASLLNVVVQDVELRIISKFKKLSQLLQEDIVQSFESPPTGSEFHNFILGQLNLFRVALDHLNYPEANLNTTNFLANFVSTLTSFLPNSNRYQTFADSLREEGTNLDALRSATNTPLIINPNSWFESLRRFVAVLGGAVALSPVGCHFVTHGGKRIAVAEGAFVSLKNVTDSCLPLGTGSDQLLILASHTVTIDTDLNGVKTQDMSLAIIAPNWVIPSDQSIILHGSFGRNNDAIPPKQQHGAPGVPGRNGGDFIGVATNVWGGKLGIKSIGGNGGRGQNGGEGHDGPDGEEVSLDRISYASSDSTYWITSSPYHYNGIGLSCARQQKKCRHTLGIRHRCRMNTHHDCFEYWFFGANGQPGGSGGNGGSGGLGGKMGNIRLVVPEHSKTYFRMERINGNRGGDGAGGPGGKGGKNGDKVKIAVRKNNGGIEVTERWPMGIQAGGSGGQDGANALGQAHPPPSTFTASQAAVLNLFREFSDRSSQNPFHGQNLAKLRLSLA